MAGESSSLRLARVREACLLAKIIPVPGRRRRLGISGVKFYRRALEDQRRHIPMPRPASSAPSPPRRLRWSPAPCPPSHGGNAAQLDQRPYGTTGQKAINRSLPGNRPKAVVTMRQAAKLRRLYFRFVCKHWHFRSFSGLYINRWPANDEPHTCPEPLYTPPLLARREA